MPRHTNDGLVYSGEEMQAALAAKDEEIARLRMVDLKIVDAEIELRAARDENERLRSEKEVALQSKDRHKARAQHVERELTRLRAQVEDLQHNQDLYCVALGPGVQRYDLHRAIKGLRERIVELEAELRVAWVERDEADAREVHRTELLDGEQ